MTERFSPEYIAYILSDEASVLQTQWEKRGIQIGDHAMLSGEENEPHVVIDAMAGPQYFYVYADESAWERVNSIPWKGKAAEHPSKGYCMWPLARTYGHKHRNSSWLPTLTDLLGMIEEAGWEWPRNPEAWDAWKPTPVPGTAEKWASIRDTEDILSAAKLAVRVLEEGKE